MRWFFLNPCRFACKGVGVATEPTSSVVPEDKAASLRELDPFEAELIAFFVSGVRVLGLAPSIGEIYGALFISPEPLSLDDLVGKLGISKGSASQGLRFLRNLGAVGGEVKEGGRREYFRAETELKKLVGGFMREEVKPHLESASSRMERLYSLLPEGDEERRAFLDRRLKRLDQWRRRASVLLPILLRILR